VFEVSFNALCRLRSDPVEAVVVKRQNETVLGIGWYGFNQQSCQRAVTYIHETDAAIARMIDLPISHPRHGPLDSSNRKRGISRDGSSFVIERGTKHLPEIGA
jgi:hypothetical protein